MNSNLSEERTIQNVTIGQEDESATPSSYIELELIRRMNNDEFSWRETGEVVEMNNRYMSVDNFYVSLGFSIDTRDSCITDSSTLVNIYLIPVNSYSVTTMTRRINVVFLFNTGEINSPLEWKTIAIDHDLLEVLYYYIRRNPINPTEEVDYYGLTMQSGNSREYAKDKWHNRRRNKLKLSKKYQETYDIIRDKNFGSSRKKVKEKFSKKMRCEHIDIQSGIEEFSDPKVVVDMLENLMITYFAAYKTEGLTRALLILVTLLRSSIGLGAFGMLRRLIDDIDFKDAKLVDFYEWLKKSIFCIDTFKNNKYANSFITLLWKIYSFLLCPTIVEKLGECYNSKILSIIKDFFTLDFISGCFEAVAYITNAVHVFVTTGSLEGFISTHSITDELTLEFREIKNGFNMYITGDLEFLTGNKQFEFLKQVDEFLAKIVKLRKIKKGLELKIVDDWIKEVDRIKTEVRKTEVQHACRKQPFIFLLVSGSGISKSHLTNLFCQVIGRANSIPCSQDYVFYLNQANKYQSGWKNYKTIFICDDSAAMLAQTNQNGMNIADFLLRASNNVPHELLGAGIEEKGTLFNKALIGAFASNSTSQDYHSYARFPSALERRVQLKIVGRVRHQYTKDLTLKSYKSTQIDYNKIPEAEQDKLVPDAWLFDLCCCEVIDVAKQLKLSPFVTPDDSDSMWNWYYLTLPDGSLAKDLDVYQTMEFIATMSKAHFVQQEKVLKQSARTFCDDEWCEHGLYRYGYCKDCIAHRFEDAEESTEDVTDISPESGVSVTYFKPLVELVESCRVSDLKSKIFDTYRLTKDFKKVVDLILDTFVGWVESFICDCIRLALYRIAGAIEHCFSDLTKMIPQRLEDTPVGYYMRLQEKSLIIPRSLDYVLYLFYLLQGKKIKSYPFTTVYRRLRDSSIPNLFSNVLSMHEHALQLAMKDSAVARKEKELDENIMRDKVFPILVLGATGTILIPKLISILSGLYCEHCDTQMGYDIEVEDLDNFDAIPVKQWYKQKMEYYIEKPSTEVPITYSELEFNIRSNEVYLKNTRTGEFLCGLSPCNKFLLVPRHFVNGNKDDIIEVTKGKVESESLRHNRCFQLRFDSTPHIPVYGDIELIYVEKLMDHTRSRDIRRFFPEIKPANCIAGKLLYKDRLGSVKTLDCTNLIFSPLCNNEVLSVGEVPKNPFDGFLYDTQSFKGLCGAALITDTTKFSCIYGLHVGGNDVRGKGVCCFITRPQIECAIKALQPDGLVIQNGLDLSSMGVDLYKPEPYSKTVVVSTVERCDGLELLGSITKRQTMHSKVVYTPILSDVKEDFGIDYEWGPPPIDFMGDKRYPMRELLRKYSKKSRTFPGVILDKAYNDYLTGLNNILSDDNWRHEIRILSDEEVVNGVPNKRFLNGMNMATSVSKNLGGKKRDFCEQRDDGTYELSPIIMEEYHKKVELMEDRKLIYCPVIAMPKIEPTLKSKIDIGKVRVFFAAPIEYQMVIRRYLLTTCRLFCLNGHTLECAVGINPHSTDWNTLYKHLSSNSNKYLALDLVNFDLGIPVEVLSRAIDILLMPLRTVMRDEKTINACVILKHLLLYCLCDMNGDLVVLQGIIASGTNVTSILGCIVNSLYFRCAYYSDMRTKPFQKCVCLRTFGDDSVASTRDKTFTMKSIISSWHKLGIEGTDSSKGKICNISFVGLEELEFLKRKFVFVREFGLVVAPLDKRSMFKCLCCHLPPKYMTIEAITGQCVDNFLFEAKFHGRMFYENSRLTLGKIMTKHNLVKYCTQLNCTFDTKVTEWIQDNRDQLLDDQDLRVEKLVGFRLGWLLPHFSTTWFGRTQNKNRNNNKDLDLSVYKEVAQDWANLRPESGAEQQVEILDFVDTPCDFLTVGGNMPKDISDEDKTSLQNFMSRPIVINNTRWGAIDQFYDINPWELFLANKRVANRISNFNMIRGKLKVRITISGNSFLYGRMIVAYLPFGNTDNITAMTPLDINQWPPFTNLPHILLDPNLSMGGEMELPFFWTQDYIDLTASVAGGARNLGKLIFGTMVKLRHANADLAVTLDYVNVTTYAWMEDVELSVPTNSNVSGLVAQAGKEEDSTVNKPISEACTKIAALSSIIGRIPYLTPYASAVSMGAKFVGSVASIFGYSKPLLLTEAGPMIMRTTSNMATINNVDTSNKLALDIKQQMSLDPRLVGLGPADEMSFNYIATKESYFAKFNFTRAHLQDNCIFTTAVTPMICGKVDTNVVYPAACCGVAMPFSFWTGDIILKFTVVSSSFHRGKLQFAYDPNYMGGTRESNICYTQVLDIGTSKEIELCIGPSQAVLWRPIDYDWWNTTYFDSGTGIGIAHRSNFNGYISVFVVSELTTASPDPALDQDITILASVRAGDNFQVAVPNTYSTYYEIYPQSGGTEAHCVGLPQLPEDLYDKYHGEIIGSFRALLKRYVAYMRVVPSASTYLSWTVEHYMYPLSRGLLLGNVPNPGENTRVAFTWINYIMRSFAAHKGGMRWKVMAHDIAGTLSVGNNPIITANGFSNSYAVTITNSVDNTTFIRNFGLCGNSGMVLSNLTVNPLVEVEIPFQCQYKLVPKSKDMYYQSLHSAGIRAVVMRSSTATSSTSSMMFYVAAAEDFSVHYFTGWAPLRMLSS